jgi:hypothetical protein
MNIDCDESSVKNCPPRLGMFKYRGLSTDMPEVVPFVFHMAWKPAMQPSEKTADRGRIIARLDIGDDRFHPTAELQLRRGNRGWAR